MLQISSLCLLTLISYAITYERNFPTEINPDKNPNT